MCGIAGIVNHDRRPVLTKDLKKMADAIRHRGPDDEGYYVKDGIGLAFRRLSIIDLSPAGHQPMTNENGTVFIIFNGEIYNFLELRPLLEEKGHHFHSKTDTEVIVHAYEEYGEDCVQHLKGMFAFAIWDSKKKKLFCARDRFGIKPFYYLQTDKGFYFGSEIKAILAGSPYRTSLDYQAFTEYFTFQNVLSDHTLFKDIRILEPGNTLAIQNGKFSINNYWQPSFRTPRRTGSSQKLQRAVAQTFKEAVTHHLISDVPVASHLSGGMDSGSIVAVASQYIPHLMTFTGGFDTSGASGLEMFFDERKDSEIIARHFNTSHYEMVIHAGDMSWIMPKLIWHLEDLRVGMCYQNFYINELASKFVKVVLAGTGGDELFGGYPWRYKLISKITNKNEFDKTFYRYWSRLIADEEKSKAFTPLTLGHTRGFQAKSSFDSILSNTWGLSPINRALYFEMKTFLHGLLVVEDKVSAAHSLESRLPFLDNDLVDLALSIPPSQKIHGDVGKYILRKALNPLLPKEIVNKKKQGFSAPEETWYKGNAYNYIRSILLNKRSIDRGYFNKKFIEHVIEHHHKGLRNYRLLIWSLLSFEWWNRVFIDKEFNIK